MLSLLLMLLSMCVSIQNPSCVESKKLNVQSLNTRTRALFLVDF